MLKILKTEYSQAKEGLTANYWFGDTGEYWLITSPAHSRISVDIIARVFIFLSFLLPRIAAAHVHLDCSLFSPPFSNKMLEFTKLFLMPFLIC